MGESMIDLREGFSADPNSAVDFPLPHAKMVPYNRHRHAIALDRPGRNGSYSFL